MPGHIERKEVIYMLILVSFVLTVFYFYKGQYLLNDMLHNIDGAQKTQVIPNKSAAKRAFQKSIETSLNQMLSDVFNEMQEYRKRRKILDDIVRPQNLRDPQYIEESYQLTQRTIPDLKNRSANIIKIFDSKESEIKTLIQGRSQNAQDNILAAWNNMKAKQVNLYVQYFTIEQEILAKYQTLVSLYYKNRNDVLYYEETNQTAFKSPNLNLQATQLSQDIQNLKMKQSTLSK